MSNQVLVETSARHLHLSQKDLETLFGEGYQLTPKKDLSQPGQFACEEKVKEETGMPSRCMPFEQEHIADTCPVCGKPANKMVVWGIAY